MPSLCSALFFAVLLRKVVREFTQPMRSQFFERARFYSVHEIVEIVG